MVILWMQTTRVRIILHERFSSEVFWTVSKHTTRLPLGLFLLWCSWILQVHMIVSKECEQSKVHSHVILHIFWFQGPNSYLDEERALKHHLLQLQRTFAGQLARKHGPSWPLGKKIVAHFKLVINISGRLCIWCLLGSLHINDILPSEHDQDSHAEDPGWGVPELPQCFPPLVEGARCLGDVQGGARELHPLFHVMGNH